MLYRGCVSRVHFGKQHQKTTECFSTQASGYWLPPRSVVPAASSYSLSATPCYPLSTTLCYPLLPPALLTLCLLYETDPPGQDLFMVRPEIFLSSMRAEQSRAVQSCCLPLQRILPYHRPDEQGSVAMVPLHPLQLVEVRHRVQTIPL